jgi:transposase
MQGDECEVFGAEKRQSLQPASNADEADDHEDQHYGVDQSGDELPPSIRNQNERISKLKQLQKELTESDKEKINTTDADSAFMKTSNGIKISYNGQAADDQEHQVIVATDVTNQPADVEQLIPMIDQAEENTSDSIDACSADSGSSSGENLKELEDRSVEVYIPDRDYQAQTRGKKQTAFHKNEFVYDQQRDLYICPNGEELVFSHRQKRNGKKPLFIYQCKSCRQCQFFGQCTTNDNGRTISRHPHEEQLKQMRE